MNVYKFHIPSGKYVSLPPDNSGRTTEFSGCLAVALAKDVAEAKDIIREWNSTFGGDGRWLDVATVTVIALDRPRFIAYAEV